MAQNANTKRIVNIVAILIVLNIVAFTIVFLVRHFSSKPQQQSAVNYTQNICEDAYKTESHRYETENPEFIDVSLQEGCFSGFVSIPKAWTDWQRQMLHPASDDWLSMWYRGWENPAGPYWAAQVNSQRIQFPNVPSKEVRLEGKGVLRFYRITATSYPATAASDRRATANSAASEPERLTATLPASPPHNLLFEIEQCTHEPPVGIKCWGYATNKGENLETLTPYDGTAVDDHGNVLQVGTFGGGFSIGTEKLMPNVRTRFEISLQDKYVNVQKLNFQLNVTWEDVHQGITFNDVPVQR